MYENAHATTTYTANMIIPIWVMRNGRLNIPVPNAPAIIANIAALNDILDDCER